MPWGVTSYRLTFNLTVNYNKGKSHACQEKTNIFIYRFSFIKKVLKINEILLLTNPRHSAKVHNKSQ